MIVLGSWGLANIAAGGIGYFTAKQDEWKYFHEMNFLWGVVNTAIAGIGLADVKNELAAKLSYQKSYTRYLATKRLYLINAGLDILYIGAGVGLSAYSTTAKNGADIYKGFGRLPLHCKGYSCFVSTTLCLRPICATTASGTRS